MNIPKISIEREKKNNPFNMYVGRDLQSGAIVSIGYSFYEVICNYTNAIAKGKVRV